MSLQRLGSALGASVEAVFKLIEIPFVALEKVLGKRWVPWLFLAPNMILFSIFTFLPIGLALAYAFTGGTELLLWNRPFVGLENFRQLLSCGNYLKPDTCVESVFWISVFNTGWFVAFNVIITLLIALVTALILNKNLPGRGFFRAAFFYPVLLSPVVIGLGMEVVPPSQRLAQYGAAIARRTTRAIPARRGLGAVLGGHGVGVVPHGLLHPHPARRPASHPQGSVRSCCHRPYPALARAHPTSPCRCCSPTCWWYWCC